MPVIINIKYSRESKPERPAIPSVDLKDSVSAEDAILVAIPASLNETNLVGSVKEHFEPSTSVIRYVRLSQFNKTWKVELNSGGAEVLTLVWLPNISGFSDASKVTLDQALALLTDLESKESLGFLTRHSERLEQPVQAEMTALKRTGSYPFKMGAATFFIKSPGASQITVTSTVAEDTPSVCPCTIS